MALRILFLGTPSFAVPSLERILASAHTLVGVVTQPDRPRGRHRRLTPPEVKVVAERHGLPVFQPTRLKSDERLYKRLAALDADLGVVAAYGRILPQRLLELPRLGMINVHASLLPRWRGAAPVHRAILAGDRTTGVTIMRVVLELDAGPMLARADVEILPDETSGELEMRLADVGADLLVDTVDRLAAGPVTETSQDESQVTYASRLERADSPIDWARPALTVHNQIRGLQPWPQACTWLNGLRLILRRSRLAGREPTGRPPGTVLVADGDRLEVAASPGSVQVLELQPEGRPPMPVRAFLNGHRLTAGARLDPPPTGRS